MLVIEVAGLVLGAVGLVLAQIERRRGGAPARTRKALISLHRIIDDWAKLAESVNRIIEINLDAGGITKGGFDPFEGLPQQMEYAKALERQTESDKRREDPGSAISTLAVYAPEAKEALLAAAKIRLELVQAVMVEFSELASSGDLPVDQLRASAADLRTAAEKLRAFISDNFPPGGQGAGGSA